MQAPSIPKLRIVAISVADGSATEIVDLYWFEENYVHSLDADPGARFMFRIYVDDRLVFTSESDGTNEQDTDGVMVAELDDD